MIKIALGSTFLIISLLLIAIPIYKNYRDDKIEKTRKELEKLYQGVRYE